MEELAKLERQVNDEKLVRQQLVVSKDARIEELEKREKLLRQKLRQNQKILDEDRISIKGLEERYYKEKEITGLEV